MPLNGSGSYSAPASTWNPAVTSTTINSTDWAALLADITTALSTAMYKDGQATPTANIPMGGFKFTGLAAGSASGNSLRYEQVNGVVTTAGDLLQATGAGAFTRVAFGTKGDLLTGSGAGVGAALAVGTDGYFLTPLAGATSGLSYLPPNMGFSLVNGYLDFSVATSALTVAIKGFDGNDPSATNPVYVLFRSATAATGSLTLRKITAATSVVVSSGSTLGTTSSIAFRVWIVGFDDGGTFRLGVINCVSTAAGSGTGRDITGFYPLTGWGVASSTAEGGAGAADSSQTFYTGTAVSSKAYTTLGYATWETGLGTAGTWSAGPTRAQLWGPTVPLPGQILQVQRTDTGAVATGTTVVAYDDTLKQNTAGDQYMSQAITPTSAANILDVETQAHVSNNQANPQLTTILCQDSTANAIATARQFTPNSTGIQLMAIKKRILSSLTAATTFKVRAGGDSAGATSFNGTAGNRRDGGILNSFIETREVMG